MMHDTASISSMFLLGLLGAGHCLGMCGGISAALGMGIKRHKKILILLSYNIGRITSYACAGAFTGLLAYWGATYLALGPVLRIASGILLILMGFYIAGWWKLLTWLERLGTVLWRKLQPLASACFPVQSLAKALLAGVIWGWLPCGLVYSALAYSATSASPLSAAGLMLAFGLGTTPAVLLGGAFPQALGKVLQRRVVRQLMGLILILFGIWVLQMLYISQLQHHTM